MVDDDCSDDFEDAHRIAKGIAAKAPRGHARGIIIAQGRNDEAALMILVASPSPAWSSVPAAPGSPASVRPVGVPLLRLGQASDGMGIEPAPALPPRGTFSLKSSKSVGRAGEPQGRRPPHYASQNRDLHHR